MKHSRDGSAAPRSAVDRVAFRPCKRDPQVRARARPPQGIATSVLRTIRDAWTAIARFQHPVVACHFCAAAEADRQGRYLACPVFSDLAPATRTVAHAARECGDARLVDVSRRRARSCRDCCAGRDLCSVECIRRQAGR